MVVRQILMVCMPLVLTSPRATCTEANVLFVLHGSGSMHAKVEGHPKIEVARTVMGTLIKSLPPDVHVGFET
jgi:hypothetical protein